MMYNFFNTSSFIIVEVKPDNLGLLRSVDMPLSLLAASSAAIFLFIFSFPFSTLFPYFLSYSHFPHSKQERKVDLRYFIKKIQSHICMFYINSILK